PWRRDDRVRLQQPRGTTVPRRLPGRRCPQVAPDTGRDAGQRGADDDGHLHARHTPDERLAAMGFERAAVRPGEARSDFVYGRLWAVLAHLTLQRICD